MEPVHLSANLRYQVRKPSAENIDLFPSSPISTRVRIGIRLMNRTSKHLLLGFVVVGLLAPVAGVHAADIPRSVTELWADFDPRKAPLETEILKAWEQDGVVCRIVRYQVGVFRGQRRGSPPSMPFRRDRINYPACCRCMAAGSRHRWIAC